MLVDSDLVGLGRYLTARENRITGGGHTSYRSTVTNLKQHSNTITSDGFFNAVGREFVKHLGDTSDHQVQLKVAFPY